MFSMGPAPLPFLPCPILPFTLPSSHQVCRDAKTFGDRPIPTPEAHGIPFHPYLWENSSSARAVRPGCRVETFANGLILARLPSGNFFLAELLKSHFGGVKCGADVTVDGGSMWGRGLGVRPPHGRRVPISRSGMERRRGEAG